jgi:hypothetical protein
MLMRIFCVGSFTNAWTSLKLTVITAVSYSILTSWDSPAAAAAATAAATAAVAAGAATATAAAAAAVAAGTVAAAAAAAPTIPPEVCEQVSKRW